jgi:serine/threonine protein kinase
MSLTTSCYCEHPTVYDPAVAHTSLLLPQYTKSCDIWSIGVITYILLCGYPPFYGESDTEIFDSVRTGRFDFPSPEWDTISDNAKDFVKFLLQKDPDARYDFLSASAVPGCYS